MKIRDALNVLVLAFLVIGLPATIFIWYTSRLEQPAEVRTWCAAHSATERWCAEYLGRK